MTSGPIDQAVESGPIEPTRTIQQCLAAAEALEAVMHEVEDLESAELIALHADRWRAEAAALAASRLRPVVCPAARVNEPFDLAAHLARQRGWSERTFGPGDRAKGVVAHLRKELVEVEADPADLTEWIDVVILALDGAWRSGASPQQIIDALVAKQTRNEQRDWPDWRTADPDGPIEHVREPAGIALITAERRRQVEVKGYTPEHDAEHVDGELARAAACYAVPQQASVFWPWPFGTYKRDVDRVHELAKAGALIVAEIDRLLAVRDA